MIMKRILTGLLAVVTVLGWVTMGEAQPYTCTGLIFNDVNASMAPPPVGELFCGFIEEFSRRGITSGCQADDPLTTDINEAMFCHDIETTRAQMAVFVTRGMDIVTNAVNAIKGPPGKYAFIKTSNVRINGGNNQARITPGAGFTVAIDFNYAIDLCPGCIGQLYVGLDSENGPQQCPFSDQPGASPGITQTRNVNLTAPITPGVYYIGIDFDLQFNCFDPGPGWPHGPPTTNDRIIGSISVF
ncbi:MAG: hypothetical protein A2V86_00585 [Deltaproteobacteria bacterium RBG_16_49_23]|nr:MAG: hypothetical protein A2V86_00585 [Deltaproteobacteria bacterium RBG_16_49_23]